jgi:hypothetical protein
VDARKARFHGPAASDDFADFSGFADRTLKTQVEHAVC